MAGYDPLYEPPPEPPAWLAEWLEEVEATGGLTPELAGQRDELQWHARVADALAHAEEGVGGRGRDGHREALREGVQRDLERPRPDLVRDARVVLRVVVVIEVGVQQEVEQQPCFRKDTERNAAANRYTFKEASAENNALDISAIMHLTFQQLISTLLPHL